jgi:hypothetical protein
MAKCSDRFQVSGLQNVCSFGVLVSSRARPCQHRTCCCFCTESYRCLASVANASLCDSPFEVRWSLTAPKLCARPTPALPFSAQGLPTRPCGDLTSIWIVFVAGVVGAPGPPNTLEGDCFSRRNLGRSEAGQKGPWGGVCQTFGRATLFRRRSES